MPLEVIPDSFDELPLRLAGSQPWPSCRALQCGGIPQKLLNYMAAARAGRLKRGIGEGHRARAHRDRRTEWRCRSVLAGHPAPGSQPAFAQELGLPRRASTWPRTTAGSRRRNASSAFTTSSLPTRAAAERTDHVEQNRWHESIHPRNRGVPEVEASRGTSRASRVRPARHRRRGVVVPGQAKAGAARQALDRPSMSVQRVRRA